MAISIGVPIYNEEKNLQRMVSSLIESCKVSGEVYEIILCCNGCTDNSFSIAQSIASTSYRITAFSIKRGKKNAQAKIWGASNYSNIIFIDSDTIVDKNCIKNISRKLKDNDTVCVVGQPKPIKKKSFWYKVMNARMLNPHIEIAKYPVDGNKVKPFVHGRVFGIKKEKINLLEKNKCLADDIYLSHSIILKYGRLSLVYAPDAIVAYQPVQKLRSWIRKWIRIWTDIALLYKEYPKFRPLKKVMKTRLDWKAVQELGADWLIIFLTERFMMKSAKVLFRLHLFKSKTVGKTFWKPLDDTKVIDDVNN